MTIITMGDRSKNRKPLQRGRSLSIEAIQTVQALKRAAKVSDVSLEQVFDDVRKEAWYRPQLILYAEMVVVLGSNGLLEKVELLIMELKAEPNINPDLRGFNALLESLMSLNLTGLAVECYYLMKSASCDPDKQSFKTLIDCLTSKGEVELSAIINKLVGDNQ